MIYLVTGQKSLFPENAPYKVISVEESLELLKPLTTVGLDTETEGFNPYLKKLLLLQLGNRDFQVVIDCMTINVQRYKEYLESDRLFIGWNLKFDVKFLFYHCIVPKNLYDGYLAEKMIWLGYPSGMHSLSLKSAGEHYLGVELDKTVRGQIIWKKELTDEIIEYAANDVKYLEDIMIKQKEVFRNRGQKELSLELENRAILPTAYFEHCGVYLNPVDWQEKMKKDAEALTKAQNELDEFIVEYYNQHNSNIAHGKTMKVYVDDSSTNSITGKDRKQIVTTEEDESFIISEGPQPSMESKNVLRDFPFVEVNLQASLFDGMDGFDSHVGEPRCIVNWNSSKQVIPLLEFFGFNLKVPDKEHGGMKKSVDATVIEGQKNIHPIAEVYLRFKAAQKVTSTYGQNFLDLRNPVTGRIHTQFNQIGTDTHRYSSGGGTETEIMPGKKIPLVNLQNLPADEITRSCFQAEPGNIWISADYSGEESVILANIARDQAMIDLFTNGCGDLHSLVAKMVYPDELKDIPVEQVKKLRPDLRKKAKAPEFTFAYGGDANTLMNRDHIPAEEAKAIENNYRKGFKGVATYQSQQRKLVMKLGYINTCPEVGFRAYIYDFDELSKIQARFSEPNFWDDYRSLKVTNPSSPIVEDVKHYFKRKSASERQSINYPMK